MTGMLRGVLFVSALPLIAVGMVVMGFALILGLWNEGRGHDSESCTGCGLCNEGWNTDNAG